MAATFTRRALGALSRRLGRPELLSAFYAGVRRDEQDALGIGAALAASLAEEAMYVDVGANRGQVLREAVRLAPRANHLAFEPIPALARELQEEFPRVEVRAKAIGARPERARFCHFTTLDGWSGLQRNPAVSDQQGAPQYIDVEVSTLDAELEGRRPAVVKIDVEGAELAVLEGARGLLERARPLVIFEHVPAAAAIYGHDPGRLWDLLAQAGYRITSVTGAGPFERGDFLAAGEVVNWLARPRS